ncbi:thioesterase II family protein [Streptomyces sp. BBFR2]|uniref:thioesterase II family protein n=1 Tax=Streptomyces sp. BBFR2 TaxID=3372854 RepID=UPI0037D9F4EA
MPSPAPLRLFLLHHAGGSGAHYDKWRPLLPADWEIHTPDLPGRGSLGAHPPVTTCAEAVAFLRQGPLSRPGDAPYAVFGHSLGGIVAYELTRTLQELGEPLPVWLGVSACGAPPLGDPVDRSSWTDEDLRGWLASAGGTAAEVLRHPLAWQLFGRSVRSDLRIVDDWRPDPDAPPLRVPLAAFGAEGDTIAPPDRLRGWDRRSRHPLGVHLHPGGHFYLHDRPQNVVRQLRKSIEAVRKRPALRGEP